MSEVADAFRRRRCLLKPPALALSLYKVSVDIKIE